MTFNARLDEVAIAENTTSRFFRQQVAAAAAFEDGGRFNEAREALSPHLKKLMNQELEVLLDRSKSLRDIQPGSQSASNEELMRTKEEEIVYPILRICNQLQSVLNNDRRSFNTQVQPKVCAAFNCRYGTKTFQDFLANEGIAEPETKKCESVSCQSQYHRYVCQEKNKISSIRSSIQTEFLPKGTMCGNPIAQGRGI